MTLWRPGYNSLVSRLPTPRAILLDLDDTIIDDSGSVDSGWTIACHEAAASASGLDGALLKASILEVRDWYWADAERHRSGRQDLRAAGTWIVAEALRRLGVEGRDLAPVIANRYRDIRDEALCLLPAALETLDRMRAAGSRLGLITNGSAAGQRAKIQRFGLAPYFDYICVEGEFGCGKPDERVYRAALGALRAEPAGTWMAGDNLEWDVAAPMRLGVWGIWIDASGSGLPPAAPARPDLIVGSIAELEL